MTAEIEKHINELLSLITDKSDLHQIVFDVNLFTDKISYITVTGQNNGDHLAETVKRELEGLSSETIKEYFRKLLKSNDLWLFEPARFKSFAEDFELAALKTDFIEITTAIQLKDEDIYKMASGVSKRMGRRVIVDTKVNANLIGGAIIKKENYILDYSIETKLKNLGEKWKASIAKNKK